MREMLINNRSYKNDRAGYDIGGKSGTAQVVRNGAYDDSFAELVGSDLFDVLSTYLIDYLKIKPGA